MDNSEDEKIKKIVSGTMPLGSFNDDTSSVNEKIKMLQALSGQKGGIKMAEEKSEIKKQTNLLLATFVIGFLCAVGSLLYQSYTIGQFTGQMTEKVATLEKRFDKTDAKIDNLTNTVNSTNEQIAIIKTKIEYIEKQNQK